MNAKAKRVRATVIVALLIVPMGAHIHAVDESKPWMSASETRTSKVPAELVDFEPYEHNPLFSGRGPGFWDELMRERGWISHDSNQWRLWYTGYRPGGPMKLGYATSTDGLSWKRYGDGPIYDEHWVEDMMVVQRGDRYYMFAEGLHDRAQWLTSNDGIHWTREGTLDVRRRNGKPIPEGPFGTPTVFFHDDRWWLFYERDDDGVWVATSDDLKIWTNLEDEPVLRPGPDFYDNQKIAVDQIVSYRGRYYAYYHGLGDTRGIWTTNIATSNDLVHWKKYSRNPLLPVEANRSPGILVQDGRKFRFYTMGNQMSVHDP